MNKVVLIGRLVRDPELKYNPGNGNAIASFTLAVDRKIKKEGQPEADFIGCVAFGKTAETIATYFTKGRLIGVSGNIHTGSFEDKEGKKVYKTHVYVEEFQFLEKGNKNNDAAPSEINDNGLTLVEGDTPF